MTSPWVQRTLCAGTRSRRRRSGSIGAPSASASLCTTLQPRRSASGSMVWTHRVYGLERMSPIADDSNNAAMERAWCRPAILSGRKRSSARSVRMPASAWRTRKTDVERGPTTRAFGSLDIFVPFMARANTDSITLRKLPVAALIQSE